jgi:hypothetical protein
VCPHCAAQFATTVCLDCGEQRPLQNWIVDAYAGLGAASGGFPAKSGRFAGFIRLNGNLHPAARNCAVFRPQMQSRSRNTAAEQYNSSEPALKEDIPI